MYLICVSLNYHHLGVEEREQYTFNAEEVQRANLLLNQEKSILENVILATCNRTEVYAVVDQLHTGRYYIKRFLASWFHHTPDEFEKRISVLTHTEVVQHLFEVAAGLDSKLKGEPQILGQVKDAYATALTEGTTGALFNHLFKQAVTFAKRMHTEYRVSELAQSSGQAGLHQIKVNLQSLRGKRLLVVGSGRLGSHTVANASTMGFAKIIVINRHDERAIDLVSQYGDQVESQPFANLPTLFAASDAAVFATATKEPLVSVEEDGNDQRPEVIVDLGVPRNVQCLGNPQGYYNIDSLQMVVDHNQEKRQKMLEQIAGHVAAEVAAYFVWEKQLHIVPVIRQLRENAQNIEKTAYDSLLRKLPNLDGHQRKVISKHMKSIINQMLKGPVKEIKDLSVQDDANLDIDLFCKVFGLTNLRVEQQTNEE